MIVLDNHRKMHVFFQKNGFFRSYLDLLVFQMYDFFRLDCFRCN